MITIFGNGKCKITFNNACVDLAILQNELYLLSLRDDVNIVCDDGNVACNNENVSSSTNVNRKQKRAHVVLSKLWHYRLGHISRGRIERLVKKRYSSSIRALRFRTMQIMHKRKVCKEN